MVELWFVFSILSATLWAASSIIDKLIMPKHVKTPAIPIFLVGISNLVSALIVALAIPHAVISTNNLILSFLAGILWGFVPFVYFNSLLTQEVSRIISLLSISPLLVLIFATIFLGEVLSYERYLGVSAIILGSLLITLKIDGKSKFSINQKLLLVVAATFVISISQILSKFVLKEVQYWNFYVWLALGSFLSTLLVSMANFKSLNAVKKLKAQHLGFLIASRILGVSGLISMATALSYGLASLVSVVFSIQSFLILAFAFILSFFGYRVEKLRGGEGLLKLMAIIFMIFGVFIISL